MNTPDKLPAASQTAYTAFLSYSHAADKRLAPAIQSGLHRFGRPWHYWHRRKTVRIFRDKTSLSVTPGLWLSIERALGQSGSFIYLASPAAADSEWVRRELDFWCKNRSSDRLFIVLTEGTIRWDSKSCTYTKDSDAIPVQLRDAFSDEPLYIDLRWARDTNSLSLRHHKFREAIAELISALTGRPKDDLVGEDIRRQRTGRNLAIGLMVSLLALSIMALSFGFQWRRASIRSMRNAKEATSRALAIDSMLQTERKPDLALLLAAEAYEQAPTLRAMGSLQSALKSTRYMKRFLNYNRGAVKSIAFNETGEKFAILHGTDGSAIHVFQIVDLKEVWRSPIEREISGEGLRIARTSTHLSLAFQAHSDTLFTVGLHGLANYDVNSGIEGPLFNLDPRLLPYKFLQFDSSGSRATWIASRYIATRSFAHDNIRFSAGAESPTTTALSAISANGSRLTVADEGIVRVWDFDRFHTRAGGEFPYESALVATWMINDFFGIKAIAIDPTGESVAVLSKNLYLFRAGSAAPIWSTSTNHANIHNGVSFWPGQELLVTWGGGGSTGGASISNWRIKDGAYAGNLLAGFKHSTTMLGFSRDGRSMVSGDISGQCIVWDFHRDPFVLSINDLPRPNPTAATFHPTLMKLFVGYANGDLLVFDYKKSAFVESKRLAADEPVIRLRLDGKGEVLVAGTKSGTVKVLNSETLDQKTEFKMKPGWNLTDIAIDFDGRKIALAAASPPPAEELLAEGDPNDSSSVPVIKMKIGPQRKARIYLLDAATLQNRLPPIEQDIMLELRLNFDPIGEWLLLSSAADGVTIFKTSDGTRTGKTLSGISQTIQFLPGQRLIYQKSEDFHLTLLNAQELSNWLIKPSSFPPDGINLEGHDDPVMAWALHPDGTLLATSSYGGTTILWDTARGIRIGASFEMGDHVDTMTFTPLGRQLIALRTDGRIVSLNCDPHHWAAIARSVANREMTLPERQRHGP